MRKLLFWISGTSFIVAGALAVMAVTGTGFAAAQSSDIPTQTAAVEVTDSETIDSFVDLANDFVDDLVADGYLTDDEADELRQAIADGQAELKAVDWDEIKDQARLQIELLQRQLSTADWDDIRRQIEQALGELDWDSIDLTDLEEFGIDPDDVTGWTADESDWDRAEDLFDEFQDFLGEFDFDEALSQFESMLDDIDWDEITQQLEQQLEGFDFGTFEEWHEFEGFDGWEDFDFDGFDLGDLRDELRNSLEA